MKKIIQKIKNYIKNKEDEKLAKQRRMQEKYVREMDEIKAMVLEEERLWKEVEEEDREIDELIADIRKSIDAMEDDAKTREIRRKFELHVSQTMEERSKRKRHVMKL